MYFIVKDVRKANFSNSHAWRYAILSNLSLFETFRGWLPPMTPPLGLWIHQWHSECGHFFLRCHIACSKFRVFLRVHGAKLCFLLRFWKRSLVVLQECILPKHNTMQQLFHCISLHVILEILTILLIIKRDILYLVWSKDLISTFIILWYQWLLWRLLVKLRVFPFGVHGTCRKGLLGLWCLNIKAY